MPDGTMQTIPGSSLVPYTPPVCEGTGGIAYEFWAGASPRAVEVDQLPSGTAPTSTSTLSSFSAPANVAENYFARLRGYLCVPMSGMYRFHLSADDRAELQLSTDESPANKRRIAYQRLATAPGEYGAFPTQQSELIYLEAGRRYYIEATLREFEFRDHLTVAWTMPDGTMQTIPGSSLVPYTSGSMAATGTGVKAVAPEATLGAFTASPNPFQDKAKISFSVATSEDVRLEVYNLQGKLMQTLYTGKAEPGKAYEYEFDGSKYVNGVYICRITVGGKTTVKRLLLAR
ncbi:hypothetical protein GCM10011405_04540 [Rufibacter glacialis]|nr:hypothetical protein GCM10011405_04540 [Rufibacter glacialis]